MAYVLGGEIHGHRVLAPGPGHSKKDRSLQVTLELSAPDGFVVHSFAGDDPLVCKDYVREKCGLPPWEPGRHDFEFRHFGQKPVGRWNYFNADGTLACIVCRYNLFSADEHGQPKKEYRPWVADDGVWKQRAPKRPRPPYNLLALIDRSEAGVLIVEGEKAADRAAKRFPDVVPVTSIGGAEGANATDWSVLRERRVLIWRDNDLSGRKYEKTVEKLAREAGAVSFVAVEVPPGFPAKWDLGDDLPPGVSEADLRGLLNEARKKRLPADARKTLVWGEALPIEAPLLPVPAFDAEVLLPPALKDWVFDIANRMPCPIEYVATAVLVSAGTVIGARCAIKPKKRDDWVVVPNPWGGIVGPPSTKKTPSVNAAMKPLDRLIARERTQHERNLKEFEVDALVHQSRIEALEKNIKQAVKNEKGGAQQKAASLDKLKSDLLSARDGTDERPTLRRYRTNDTTVEKAGELLRENPFGLLIMRDELAGLLASWDKEGHEGDRAFYLEAWNGSSSFDTDRIGRGSILIPNLCVSILGGMQPDKLTMYLEQAANSLANDGLLQRFQLLVYPDPVPWRYVDQSPDKKAQQQVFELFEKLDEFAPVVWGAAPPDDFNRFPAFRFDDEAQGIFIEWSSGLHGRNDREDNPLIEQHLAKYDKLFPALALIFHLLDCAEGELHGSITKDCALRAAAWCEFLEAHARRCYGLLADHGLRAAQMLASKIKAGEVTDGFTARDVRRRQWRYLTKDEPINAALEWLEDSGWLQSEETGGTGPGTGRRTTRYRINHVIQAQMRSAA